MPDNYDEKKRISKEISKQKELEEKCVKTTKQIVKNQEQNHR